MPPRRTVERRRVTIVAGLAAAALAVVLVLVLGGSGRKLVPGGGNAGDTFDPLAYSDAKAAQFEANAAAGLSNVIYAKSPGGAVASARRTAAFRPQIDAAAAAGPIDADTIEAIVLLESAGRRDVVAGKNLRDAAGLTQILAATGQQLLGMRIDLNAAGKVAAKLRAAVHAHDKARVAAFDRALGRVDQRFDPAASLAATERYLSIAERTFGRADLAVESYHMGIGNLASAVRLYAGPGHASESVAKLVADNHLSYAKLAFDSTPLHHAAAYNWISQFGDDSSTYYWRVLAAQQIMRLYRTDPAGLAHEAALQTASGSAEGALLPPNTTFFDSPDALSAAKASGTLIAVPTGAQAAKYDLAPAAAFHLRREALAALLYIGTGVRAIGRSKAPLQITAAATDTADLAAQAAASSGLSDADPTHATGYAFDVARSYGSHQEALAFQFMLDRMQTLNLIAWERHQREIHVFAGPAAASLEGVLPNR